MKCATRKIRPPVKRHGGKTYLCRRIIDLFPDHDDYLEPFAGGLSTLLNKPKCGNETACDLDEGLIETWRVIRDGGHAVLADLKTVPYSQESFDTGANLCLSKDGMNRAIGFIIRNRMSRGGLGKDFAWSDRLRGGQPGDMNAWQTFIENDLPTIIERIRDVVFICRPATEVIKECVDSAPGRLLIYADPPYVHETRTHKTAYEHEMTTDDHRDLISCLKRAGERGAKVFLSGYANGFYDEWIPSNWTIHRFEMPNHSGQGKTKERRTELLWESP